MAKIRIDTVLKNANGDALMDAKATICPVCKVKHQTEEPEKLTMGDAMMNACLSGDPEKKIGQADMKKNYEIYFKILQAKDDGVVELTTTEIGIIEKLLPYSYHTIVGGQVMYLMDHPDGD